jgi:hypothetical protein
MGSWLCGTHHVDMAPILAAADGPMLQSLVDVPQQLTGVASCVSMECVSACTARHPGLAAAYSHTQGNVEVHDAQAMVTQLPAVH